MTVIYYRIIEYNWLYAHHGTPRSPGRAPTHSSSQLVGTSCLPLLIFPPLNEDDPVRNIAGGGVARGVTDAPDRVHGVALDPSADVGGPELCAGLPDLALLAATPGLAVPLLHAGATDPDAGVDLITVAGLRRSPRLPRREGAGVLA